MERPEASGRSFLSLSRDPGVELIQPPIHDVIEVVGDERPQGVHTFDVCE
jgi:hypothetical protein